MFSLLSGIGTRVWGYVIAAVAVLGAVVAIFNRGSRAGRDAAVASAQGAAIKAQDAQAEAVAKAPKDREELNDRLNKGTF